MTRIPREARDGLMRAWLAMLREKHPQVTWIAVEQEQSEGESVADIADSSSLADADAVEHEILVPAA